MIEYLSFFLFIIGAAGMDSPNRTPAVICLVSGLLLMLLCDKINRICYIAKRLLKAVIKEARKI